MDPDKYQQAWQAHETQTRVTIHADLLRKEMQRDQRDFRTVVFWGDVGEAWIAILLVPVWIYLGIATSSPWTWYLVVPALVWQAGFVLVQRMRRRQKPIEPDEPLLGCVERSLAELEQQIWSERSAFWMSSLPAGILLLVYFAHATWLGSDDWLDALGYAPLFALTIVIFGFIYFMNQYTLPKKYQPRRQELLTLLASLQDEAGENADDHVSLPALPFRDGSLRTPGYSRARVTIGMLAAVMIMTVTVGLVVFIFNTAPYLFSEEGYPKKSPFAAVRWEQYQPEVRLGEEWFKLVSLDELPAAEIVAFSRRTYGDRWRKRFEEDLVELLTGMKHPPRDQVTLVVQSLTSSETQVREDVPMTYANRRAIYDAADKRAIPEPQRKRVARAAVSIDNAEQFNQRVDEFLQLARVKTGFSGVVVVARGGEPVYQGAFGFSHLASRIPNSLDTPFRIASLSKQFTAAAILSLEAEGKLSTDDPVHRYLPEFTAEPYRRITIYHLLTHTSGLPRTPEEAARHARWDAMSRAPTPVNDYVRLACQCPLTFEPGQDFQYSNFGYRVLSAIIVQITGEEYADFMEERLFTPLSLRQSGVARISQPSDEARVAEVVSFVVQNHRTREPSFVSTDSGRNYGTGYGSGGIYASANDLLRWDRILADESFLPAEQQAKLFRPVRKHYACGWIVKKSGLDGRLYQTHSGSNGGYFSKMMRIPEDNLVIIALGNVRQTDEIDEALEQLFRLCRSLPYQDL